MKKEKENFTVSAAAGDDKGNGSGENERIAEDAPFDLAEAWQAYERLKPRLAAVPASEVQGFKANVPKAVSNAVRIIRSFNRDKAGFAPLFAAGVIKAEELEDLPDRVMALWHADIRLRRAMDSAGSLPELLPEAKALQQKLRKNALFLWGKDNGLGSVLSEIRRGRSRLDTADDLAALADLFEGRWAEAENCCGITKADIEAAKALSILLVDALNTTVDTSESSYWRDQRDRAGTYLNDGVVSIRLAAMMTFKSKPDVLKDYPGLFTGKRMRRNPKEPSRSTSAPVQGNEATRNPV